MRLVPLRGTKSKSKGPVVLLRVTTGYYRAVPPGLGSAEALLVLQRIHVRLGAHDESVT